VANVVNMADSLQKDWCELCVAVTNESDSTKLTSLVQELIEALDTGKKSWRSSVYPPDTGPRSSFLRFNWMGRNSESADGNRLSKANEP
jgi:hypothetical protein